MNYEVAIHQFQAPHAGITYGFLLHCPEQNKTLGVDAGSAQPLLDLLEQNGWQLDELWITHHHFDHTAGLQEVKRATNCLVTGPKNQTGPIDGLDRLVEEGDALSFAGSKATIIHAPGHTNDMLNFYFSDPGICFVGDVLFPLGCGRLSEGTAAEMWSSLQKLAQLPDNTQIYSCHEYAVNNAKFALSVEPDNAEIKAYYAEMQRQIETGVPTVPCSLATEKKTNPFLRPHDPDLRSALNVPPEMTDVEVFARLRAMKDRF